MQLVVRGVTLNSGGVPVSNVKVKATRADILFADDYDPDAGSDFEWEATTDASGLFSLAVGSGEDLDELARQALGNRAQAEYIFRVYAIVVGGTGGLVLLGSHRVFLSESSLRGVLKVSLIVNTSYTLVSGVPNFAVSGFVDTPVGTANTITLYKKNLRTSSVLGTVTTTDGRFLIRYVGAAGDLPDRPNFSIYLTSTGATVGPICHPLPDQTVRFVTGGLPYRGPSDYELESAALTPFLDTAAFDNLTVSEVETLVCRAKVEAPAIARMARASALALVTTVPANAFYALAHAGYPLSTNVVYSLTAAEVSAAIDAAIARNVVPAALAGSKAAISAALLAARTERLVPALAANYTNTTLGAILVAGALSGTKPRLFAQAIVANIDSSGKFGDPEAFWNSLRSDANFLDTGVKRIQFTLQVGALTANHPPLVKLLNQMRDSSVLTNASELAQYDASDWLTFMATTVDGAPAGTPAGVIGVNSTEQRAFYSEAIARMVEDQYPTAHLSYRLPGVLKSNIQDFVRQNPTFSLLHTRVEGFFDGAAGLPADPEDRALLKQEVLMVQRVAAIAPRFGRTAAATGMLSAGITSARQIQAMGYPAFKAKMNAAGLSTHTDEVYAKADQVATATIHAFMHMRRESYFPTTAVITTPGCGDADLENLFGNLDYCACKHCESVYGAAAYFVDLMKFLADRGAGAGATQLDKLLLRRPELQHIKLNCENSDTPLPTIDLVNETLERRARPHLGLGALAGHHQTTWSAADLVGQPEHVDTAVYTKLADPLVAHFPLSLPFDLSLAEVRGYLEAIGLTRVDMQDALETWDDLGEDEPYRVDERLGLSRGQGAIVRHEVDPPLHKALWGFTAVDWIAQMNDVETFLDRTGLTLPELQTLLRGQFLTGVHIHFEEQCTLHAARLHTAGEADALNDATLRRLQVFLRTRRALGWTVAELDATLAALGLSLSSATVTGDLAALARFVRDRRRFPQLPLGEVLSWWSPLDRHVYEEDVESFYDQVVRPRTREVAFTDLTGDLDAVRGSLQAILRVDAAGLAAAYLATGLTGASDLDLENLSSLYRVASIARALKLPISELQTLTNYQAGLKIVPPGPFAGVPNAPVRALLAVAEAARDSGFSVPALDWVLRNQQPEKFGASDADVTRTLVNLIISLQQTAADHVQSLPPAELSQAERVARLLFGVLEADDIPAAVDFVLELTEPAPDAPTAITLRDTLLPFIKAGDVGFATFGAVFSGAPDPEPRITLLADWFRQQRLERVVIQQLATPLGLETADVELLLSNYAFAGGFALASLIADPFFAPDSYDVAIDASKVKGEDFPALFLKRTAVGPRATLYRGLRKVALVARTFRFSPGLLRWVLDHAGDADVEILDLAHLPSDGGDDNEIFATYAGWDWLRRVIELRDEVLDDPSALLGILDLVFVDDLTPTAKEQALTALALAAGWDVATLLAFELANDVTHVGLKSLTAIEALHRALRVGARLGADPRVALEWARLATISATDAAEIRGAVQSRFSAPTWPSVSQPVRDRLRERQRDALADLLVKKLSLQDRDDLFAELLMDVGISCCGRTTRLLFATAAVQLFVQRALMGLEKTSNVVLNDDDEEHWSAMKRYRVWEANRKIFLYPENWVTPELRDDKSPLFKQLEQELAQTEVDATAVERAYIHYLEGLNEIAKLTIIGMYQEREATSRGHVHVFARTAGQPSKVFYRRRVDDAFWTAWEELPFPIDAPDVLPVVAFRRLMLIWPQVTVHTVEPSTKELTDPPKKKSVERRVRLMWAELRDGEWSDVRTSEASLFFAHGPGNPDSSAEGRHPNWDIVLTSTQAKDTTLVIRPARCQPKLDAAGNVASAIVYHASYFTYDARTGSFEVVRVPLSGRVGESAYGSTGYPSPYPAINWHQGFRLPDGVKTVDPLYIPTMSHSNNPFAAIARVVNKPRNGFEVMFPRQEHKLDSRRPFTYSDPRRVFYIRKPPPVRVGRPDPEPDKLGPAAHDAIGLNSYFSFTGGKVSASQVASANPVTSMLSGGDNPATRQEAVPAGTQGTGGAYRVGLLYHPFVPLFLEQVRRYGVPGLLDPEVASKGAGNGLVYQARSNALPEDYFDDNSVMRQPLPAEDIDFTHGGAYSVYNWELFFHIPMYIADRLMAERRFDEAQRWLSYVFNPIRPPSPVGTTDCMHFWRIKPFHEAAAKLSIDDLMELLHYTGDDEDLVARKEDLQDQIEAWRDDPFRPHLIARLRPTAYMRAVVMKYLDNLIAWGDDLFRQDTRESTQEATQLYVLALQILGKRPRKIDGEEHEDRTFAEAESDLDGFSNFLVELENEALDVTPKPEWQPLDLISMADYQAQSPTVFKLAAVVPDTPGALLIGDIKANIPRPKPHFNPLPLVAVPAGPDAATTALYFCIPPNDKLLGYWDTVADRLFKLRNCLNLEGVRRDLALFDPPIDPALLAKAVAQGVDIDTAISNLNAPLPHYRFLVHLGIAKEFAGQVSALGGALLSAFEKRDAEELAVLRAGHELTLLDFTRKVREQSLKEAEDNLEAVKLGRAVVEKRIEYYKSREKMNALESLEAQLSLDAGVLELVSSGLSLGGSVAGVFPDADAGVSGIAATPVATIKIGGTQVARGLELASQSVRIMASLARSGAAMLGTQAGYTRRKEDWDFQQQLAETELPQLEKQITAAEIRVEMAKLELVNHDEQVRQSGEVFAVMQSKYTNQELYVWMADELSKAYHLAYQLAFDMARRTERCYRFELAVDSDFVQLGHWDNRREGLLAGERLGHDLRRMEAAYYENNRREYELTKRVSLAGLDPVALIALRKTGACHFQLPSVIFNLDHASHFQRRIKMVSVSVPAVTGPYTNIGVNLTLEGGEIRKKVNVELEGDGGSAQVQAISVSQEDTGMFEPNLRDERYLPFEGRGLENSKWRLELPPRVRQFDYETISDVVLTVRYTAREGGSTLANTILPTIHTKLAELPRAEASAEYGVGQVRVFSARAEFPEAWRGFVAAGLDGALAELPLDLSERRFPHPQLPPGARTIEQISVFVRWPADSTVPAVGEFADATLKVLAEDPVPMDDFTIYRPDEPVAGPGFNYLWRSTIVLEGKGLGEYVFALPDGWSADVAPEDVYIVVHHKIA